MNHSIHNLAATPINAATMSANKKHQALHQQQQLHHTLQHQQHCEPLVSQHQQQMLQFHQTLHHPYSTLHHQHQHQQTNSQSMHFNTPPPPPPPPNQQQQHQSQQYNMNSDYSSSTYHIYDQISDLIIIKQQRMERKRQQEHRRKVILISLAAILLVATSMFLIIQSLFASNAQQQQQKSDTSAASRSTQLELDSRLLMQAGSASWAPSVSGQANSFAGFNRFNGLQQPVKLTNTNTDKQLVSKATQDLCNGHGVLLNNECKCDSGFWGERCESSATFQLQSSTASQQQQQQLLLTRCLMSNCNGNGQCNLQGRCQCFPGFFGSTCEYTLPVQHQQSSPLNTMPVSVLANEQASSSNDRQVGGAPENARCNCNGNGQCLQASGKCKCFPGFIGDSCQERDLCAEQTCSNNQGICNPATGVCQCKFGFKGAQCELRDDEQWARLLNCSNHGKFDYVQRKCNCDQGFAGFDCSEERCDLNGQQQQQIDCGANGLFDCRQSKCICQDGFSGEQCQIQQCSIQCLKNNARCQTDGTCLCPMGFYGKHCTLNGCPNQCSQRGECIRVAENQQQAEWKCQCQAGTTGDDCSISIERQCDDGIDNDRDGLVDCADSECCGDKVCQNSTLCMKSPDPLDILMRKQPPPPTSSFFQRMQFLIEKFSSQIYSHPKDFNDSLLASKHVDRASVIRGRVTYMKQGVTGVRVSVAGQMNLGITLTRDGGYFDLMVNGGGAVVLEFRREPFATLQKAVRVPWNEIVLIEAVELSLETQNSREEHEAASLSSEPDSPSCLMHNYRIMRPHIVAGPKSSRRSMSASRTNKLSSNQPTTSRAVILKESGMVQQSILLPGSSSRDTSSNESVSLIYISSRANEFMSTISLQLIPPSDQLSSKTIPQDLKLIHLKIIIEGNLFEQLFEPQTNLSFTYAWNRRNVYRQKSFGLSTASVSVGYEYYDCKHIVWSTKHIQLPGHDLSISDIGSQWNLNIHHRYNYRDSILQRGDGQNFNLKTDKPRVVQSIMGDSYQRQAVCPYCDGATNPSEQRLLKPQALVSAPDGSLYIGDFNLIRRIEWSGASNLANKQGDGRIVRTVLELPTTRVPSKYNLALNLVENKLYMSDYDRYQVYLIKEQGGKQSESGSLNETTASASSLEDNLVPVVGTGAKCQPLAGDNCGDGQAAKLARLLEPKAIAFDLNNRMYIADGANVRMVDPSDGNKIYTILGDYGSTRHTKFPCSGEAIPMHKFIPRAPLDLAISPIDDTLHILDDNVVYKITQDKRVQIVAGRLAHCLATGGESFKGKQQLRATEVFLQSAQSITFGQNGDLFISEDDQKQMISRVLLVSPEEDSISLYAGLPIDGALLKSTSPPASNNNNNNNNSPTVDSINLDNLNESELSDKQRSSNVLPLSQTTRASEYKFNSVAAIAVDQQGKLLVADKMQLRILSIEPDLAQINGAGEYELQSPDNSDELLVFNRHGHHIATREISTSQAQLQSNKYTFTYNVNTPFGQLASVSYSTGNKISIYRDGPHHSVKMIETAFGGQCKLDISRNGQVHSISTIAPNTTKTNFSYHVDGGLLKQSRDQASGELFDFSYDEFGRAIEIQHTSPRLSAPVDCRLVQGQRLSAQTMNSHCSALIVAE